MRRGKVTLEKSPKSLDLSSANYKNLVLSLTIEKFVNRTTKNYLTCKRFL